MGNLTGKQIGKAIANHLPSRNKMIKLHNYYKGEKLEIENKTVSKTSKTNNKLKNPYQTQIIDQKNGYLMGNPVKVLFDKTVYAEHIYTQLSTELRKFQLRNNLDDLLSEAEKVSSICGYGVLLAYIDEEGKERVMRLNPYNVIFLTDDQGNATGEAIYYYDVTVIEDGKPVVRTKAEYYDSKNITFLIQNKNGDFIFDSNEEVNPLLHGFDYVPVIKIKNNDEEIGDFERVMELIDAYNNLTSSAMDEVDTFRLAYMLITGAELDAETLEKIKESGAFSGLDPEDKIEFITKEINDTFIENQKKTIDENIYKFSGAIDMNDERFSGGAESGEARKWKLISLENKSIVKERKFTTALRNLFRVILSSWAKKGLAADYLDLSFKFSRNFPVDLLYIAEIGMKLKGNVSEETRLKAMSGLVEDVEKEQEKMKEDASVNFDDYERELMNDE